MSQTPVPDPPIRTHLGAQRLNGTLWGLLLVAVLAVVVMSGSYAALIPLLCLLPLTGVGLVANLVFFFWKMATGRFRQALGYGLGFVLLAVFFLGLYLYLSNNRIEKSW